MRYCSKKELHDKLLQLPDKNYVKERCYSFYKSLKYNYKLKINLDDYTFDKNEKMTPTLLLLLFFHYYRNNKDYKYYFTDSQIAMICHCCREWVFIIRKKLGSDSTILTIEEIYGKHHWNKRLIRCLWTSYKQLRQFNFECQIRLETIIGKTFRSETIEEDSGLERIDKSKDFATQIIETT